jgi:hypothetical protein
MRSALCKLWRGALGLSIEATLVIWEENSDSFLKFACEEQDKVEKLWSVAVRASGLKCCV